MNGMTNLNTEEQSNTIENNSSIYRFVPHGEVKNFKKLGWEVASHMEGSHHARHAVIMKKLDTEKKEVF